MTNRVREIALGYFAACMVGGLSLAVGLLTLSAVTGPEWPGAEGFGLVIHVTLLVGFAGGLVALLPSVPVIVLAEQRGFRWLVPHLLFGAALGASGYLFVNPHALQGSFEYAPAAMFVVAGALGGLVYHRVAGRFAGARVAP